MTKPFEIGRAEYDELDALDRKFALNGIPNNSRSMAVLPEFCRSHNLQFVMPMPPVLKAISDFYSKHFSGPKAVGPVFYTGFAHYIDNAYRVDVPVNLGAVKFNLFDNTNMTKQQRFRLAQNSKDLEDFETAAVCAYDIGATVLGFSDFVLPKSRAKELFMLAAFQNQASAVVLTAGAMQSAVLQSASLAFELAVKSLMSNLGAEDDEIRKIGHKLVGGLDWLESAGLEDAKLLKPKAKLMPNYVESRYELARESRLELLELSSAAQAAVAFCARNLTSKSIADFQAT